MNKTNNNFNQFFREVDTSSREAMIDFLVNHRRYNTMNSWNALTSYANNIKIHHLDVGKEVKDAFYNMLDAEAYGMADDVLDDFANRYDGKYQIGANGCSGGYLVLYNGFKKPLEYKSYCTECGQRNYKPVTKYDHTCGVCGAERKDFTTQLFTYGVIGAGIDDNFVAEDYEDTFSDGDLRERALLVQDFDATCDAYIQRLIEVAEEYTVTEETVYVPQTRKVLVKRTDEEVL